jgi:hypothetical protein
MGNDQDAAVFFQAHYVTWAVGMMDPGFAEELDALSAPGQENWRQIMQRECRWSKAEIQAIFTRLCEEMSDEEALESILRDLVLLAT